MEKILERMQDKFGYSINENINEAGFKQREEIVIITPDQAFDLMWNSGGNIFTVVFIKRDGSERVLTARRHVKKCLRGGKLPYKPSEKKLVPCYEMKPNESPEQFTDQDCKDRYKMVSAHRTKLINYQGKTFSVDQPNA